MSDEAQVQAIFAAMGRTFGRVDIQIANSRIQQGAALAQMTLQQ